MTTSSPDPRLCLCGCGQQVTGKAAWRRGHSGRGQDGYDPARHRDGWVPPLPSPGEIIDMGIIDVDRDATPSVPVSPPGGAAAGTDPPAAAPPTGSRPGGAPQPDEPPAHARRDWHAKARKQPARPPKLTGAARADIEAKIAFALEVPGRVWQARDPLCGGTFVAQRPDISRALAEIVCRSPALVAWFTGPAGGFMVYLDAVAALWPVFQVVMAHHVYHSIDEADEARPQPDMSRYAA